MPWPLELDLASWAASCEEIWAWPLSSPVLDVTTKWGPEATPALVTVTRGCCRPPIFTRPAAVAAARLAGGTGTVGSWGWARDTPETK